MLPSAVVSASAAVVVSAAAAAATSSTAPKSTSSTAVAPSPVMHRPVSNLTYQLIRARSEPDRSAVILPKQVQQQHLSALAAATAAPSAALLTAFLNGLSYAACVVRVSDLLIIQANDAARVLFGEALQAPLITLKKLVPRLRRLSGTQMVKALVRGSLTWVELSTRPMAVHQRSDEPQVLAVIRELTRSEMNARSSRYASEFEEVDVLGRGGYGVVYRARNKIDGQEYAIKKVKLRNLEPHVDPVSDGDSIRSAPMDPSASRWSRMDQRIIREVKTFARISNHPNVVRYYAAWTEPIMETDLSSDESEEDLSTVESEAEIDDDVSFAEDSGDKRALSAPAGQDLKRSAVSLPWPEQIRQQHHLLHSSPTSPLSRQYSKSGKKGSKKSKKASAVLYIQMQLCPFNDLRRWIDNRQHVDTALNIKIFRQIVEALHFIHSKGFVHRDVKPEDDHIYLGDFGLARSLVENVVPPKRKHNRMSVEVHEDWTAEMSDMENESYSHPAESNDAGTFTYMSPEQLQSQKCTVKSDIYSLGILFLELYQQFSTLMERAIVLMTLKSTGKLPQSFVDQYPTEAAFAQRLLSANPTDRPSALEILQDRFLQPGSRFALDSSVIPSFSSLSISMSGSPDTESDGSKSWHSRNASLSASEFPHRRQRAFSIANQTMMGSQSRRHLRRWSSSDALKLEINTDVNPPILSSPFPGPASAMAMTMCMPTLHSPVDSILSSITKASTGNADSDARVLALEQTVQTLTRELEEARRTIAALKASSSLP